MMNEKLTEFKKSIVNKKIAVLGMGISNTPLVKYLCSLGVRVACFDRVDDPKKLTSYEELAGLDVEFFTGEGYLSHLHGFDIIFKTPVVRFDIPELLAAAAEGAEITSEMELFCQLCPAKIFGVTGSDGKSTTTTLIYKMLEKEGYKCRLGGNIGYPLLDRIDEIAPDEMIVLELSSFQLHTMKFSPDVAVITNITPNHLDVHSSYEEYIDAKKNIFINQDKSAQVVLNYGNDITRGLAAEASANVFWFNGTDSIFPGVFAQDGSIKINNGIDVKVLLKVDDIALRGWHNVENYMAAIAATVDYVSAETVVEIARTFDGVEHRLEVFRQLKGVTFVNDSIASGPTRTIAGLQSFGRKVILIAGGKDKNTDYSSLGAYILEYSKSLILIGQTAEKIEQSVLDELKRNKSAKPIPIIKCQNYRDVVNTAYSMAEKGDVVLFSPASTSFDQFRNFEERGELFKKLVNELK